MSSKEVAISVKNVSKSFKLPHEQHSGIKQAIISIFKKNRKRGYEVQRVLKDISFDIEKGEFFGIVGRNGSGKSTLLKLISEIYIPDKGHIQVNGKLTPFIELGVGFNPELTGRENVYMNGALLGFSNKQMDAMYDEIVGFAELERFMDQKLKNYSSGMQVRLAFSIAIRADTDILVLDEVLAVGDEAFQRKCFQYFAELKKKKKTVILVTHSMDSVQQFCTRAMLLESGEIKHIGKTNTVALKYQELFMKEEEKQVFRSEQVSNDVISCKVDFKDLKSDLQFDVYVKSKADLKNTVLTFGINQDNGEQVYRWISDDMLNETIDFKTGDEYKLTIKLQNVFPVGVFTVGVRVKDKDRTRNYAIFDEVRRFEISNRTTYGWDVLWKPQEDIKLEKK